MRALSDQFFCLLCGGPLRSDSTHTIWMGGGGGAQVSFFSYYRRPPQISLFAYFMFCFSMIFCNKIFLYKKKLYGSPSGRFLHLLYLGAPLDKFLRLLYGPPLRSVSSITICPPPPPDQFLCLLCGPLWGPLQISFFAYYIVGPLNQFLRLLYGGPLG